MSDPIQMTQDDLTKAIVAALKKSKIGQQQQKDGDRNVSSNRVVRQFNSNAEFFGKMMEQGGMAVSNTASQFLSNIPILGKFKGTAQGVIGYIEDTQQVFRQMSKTGAGFYGDLGALRAGAAQTRMSLDQFGSMVANNSERLLSLGTSVNKGAQRFAELSNNMMEGDVALGMLNLGYSLEESNELLLENATLLARQQRISGMSDDQVTQATLSMAENLAMMADISGKSAKAEKDRMIDAQRDGKNVAANRLLEARGIKDATQTFSQMQIGLAALGPAAQAFSADLNQTGVPMSKMTKGFASMAPQTADVIRSMQAVRESNLSTEEKTRRLRELEAKAIATYAKETGSATKLQVATTGQINEYGAMMADMLQNFTPTLEAVERKMQEEGVSREEATKLLREEARQNIKAMKPGGATGGQQLNEALNRSTLTLANTASELNLTVASVMSGSKTFQEGFDKGVNGLSKVTTAITGFANSVTDAVVDRDKVDATNQGELQQFSSLFNPIIKNNQMKVHDEVLQKVIEGKGPNGNVTAGEKEIDRRAKEGAFLGGPVKAFQPYIVGEQGQETFVPNMDGAIIPNMKNMLNKMPDIGKQMSSTMQDFAKQMQTTGAPISEEVRKASAQMQSSGSIEEKLDILNQTMLQLVGINNMQTQIGQKQIKAFKHSGNLMGGIGRV
jgi:hypothetical protein